MNNVLVIGNHLSATGASRAVGEDLVEKLRARGLRVHSASTAPNKAVRLCDMLHTAWAQRRRFEIAVVDVFSGQAFYFAQAVGALLHRLRKPYVLVLHGGDLPRFAKRHPRRVTRLLSAAAAVTAPSPYLIAGMRAFRDDIIEIPNPIDCAKYPYRLRRTPEPNLIWLRAFGMIYNPVLAPRALARVRERHPAARLTMIGMDRGDGAYQATQADIARLGLHEHCRVLPKVSKNEVPAALSAGDILLNTPNIDNTPVSVLEALACGLCVVSTNVGGLPHFLNHGDQALLVPPNDEQAMADAVHDILTSPELAARLSEQGRRKAESCDWPSVIDQWMELLETCAARGTK